MSCTCAHAWSHPADGTTLRRQCHPLCAYPPPPLRYSSTAACVRSASGCDLHICLRPCRLRPCRLRPCRLRPCRRAWERFGCTCAPYAPQTPHATRHHLQPEQHLCPAGAHGGPYVLAASCRVLRVASQRFVSRRSAPSRRAEFAPRLPRTKCSSAAHRSTASFTGRRSQPRRAAAVGAHGFIPRHRLVSQLRCALRAPRPHSAAAHGGTRRLKGCARGGRARRSGAAVGAGLTAARVHTHADRGGQAWPMPAPRHRHRAHSRVTAAHARRCGRA